MEPITQKPNVNSYSLVYVGTQASEDKEGIFLYRLNTSTGELTLVSSLKAGSKPTYLNLDSRKHFLYAVIRGDESVASFSVDQKTGALTFLNKQSCPGGPTHLTVDHTDKVLLVANYAGGNVGLFPIQENGSIGPASDKKQHEGSSVNKGRQKEPHAHFITPDPSNRFVFVMDLGLDKVMRYKLDIKNGKLVLDGTNTAFATQPGAGPRHMTFHPNKQFAYLINEMGSTITALRLDSENGVFSEIETVSTVTPKFYGGNLCAAIHITPNGKFLYGSNRGHNSIVGFQIDETTGKLTYIHHAMGINEPRDFTIDLTGKILLAGYQNSDLIVTYHIDSETGKLTPTGYKVQVTTPVCLKVVPEFKSS